MTSDKKLFEDYFESSFKYGNILTQEQYEKASADFERRYGRFLPEDKDAAILDIGCGSGHFLYYLDKAGYRNFQGVDLSKEQVEYCRKNITEKVKLADGMEVLASGEVYDVIVANDLMEHLPKNDVIPFLEKARAALSEEGVFIARVPNMSNPFSLESRYCDFTHEVGFTEKSLYQVLWVAGFRNIDVLGPAGTPVSSFRNLVRKCIVSVLHSTIKFFYYVQDFTVPRNLDKVLVAAARKK
ncbi:MAG: class I SAM-dependent methyltransferase [Candidatus Omnitrophica bacterium]|nr:class I SAM-dependent methyltransferase [Candidatus Omnitrophota bacterium]